MKGAFSQNQSSKSHVLDPLENEFNHQFAAKVSEQQRGKARKRPTNGDNPAPTKSDAPEKQRAKDKPGYQGEYGLMGQVLGEHVLKENES